MDLFLIPGRESAGLRGNGCPDAKDAPFNDFFNRLTATRAHIGVYNNPALMYLPTVKTAMDIIGLKGGEPRLPITGLTRTEKTELAGILKALKISL